MEKFKIEACERACKSYLGIQPFNTCSNINYYDPFYLKSVRKKFGDEMVDQVLERLRKETA